MQVSGTKGHSACTATVVFAGDDAVRLDVVVSGPETPVVTLVTRGDNRVVKRSVSAPGRYDISALGLVQVAMAAYRKPDTKHPDFGMTLSWR